MFKLIPVSAPDQHNGWIQSSMTAERQTCMSKSDVSFCWQRARRTGVVYLDNVKSQRGGRSGCLIIQCASASERWYTSMTMSSCLRTRL